MSPMAIVLFLFQLYVSVVLLRFLLQLLRADFYNPLSQFVVAVTQPVLKYLRKIVPGIGGIDWASLVFAALLVAGMIWFAFDIRLNSPADILLFLRVLLLTLLLLTIKLVFWCLFIWALMSWVDPYRANPVGRVLGQIAGPVVRPVQKVIPPVGGLDLSALFAGLLLLLAQWAVQLFLPVSLW